MGPPAPSSSDVVATIGGRVITVGALAGLLEEQRKLTTAAGGGELLLRFFDDRAETLPIPYPHSGLPLGGLSHVPAAGMVIRIFHAADRDDDTFIAHAVTSDGTDIVFAGKSTGPLKVVPGGLQHFPLMHLVMSKIAWGRPAPADGFSAISEWLLRVSLNDVATELDCHQIPDGPEEALYVEQMLRIAVSGLINAVREAADPTTQLPPISADWPELSAAFALLTGLDWDDLDGESLAEARGYHRDLGAWWGSRGIAGLDLIDIPDVQGALDRIECDRPVLARLLRRAVDAFIECFCDVGALPDSELRWRWRADDPGQLLRLVRKALADPDFRSGTAVIGYRRRNGRLEQVSRVDAADGALDLMSVESVGAADGILMITNSEGVWRAAALNRQNEHGTAVSHSAGDGLDFLPPIIDDVLVAMLRRILTGRAQADPVCSPREWVYRRVLYGVARTLETGKLDGDDEPEADDEPEESAAKADRGGSSLADLIDGILAALFLRHVGTLADAIIGGRHLAAVPAETLTGEQRWESFAEGMRHFRLLNWTDFRAEALAEAWGVGPEPAQWWGSDGLALLQLRQIPDATESLMRCAFALGRATDEGPAAMEHLIARTTQTFGDDIAVLWSLLPDLRAEIR